MQDEADREVRRSGRPFAGGHAPGAEVRFAIQGDDKQWHWGDAIIEGDTVIVSSPNVTKPFAVRYAYAMNPAGCIRCNESTPTAASDS